MTDDELDTLLRETFTAHEDLADPERAVELARLPVRRSHPVAITLAAAVVAAVVVTGSFAIQSHPNFHPPARGPAITSATSTPIEPVRDDIARLSQDLANKSEAIALAHGLLDQLPTLPGATRYDTSPVPAFAERTTFIGGWGNTEMDAGFWTAPGVVDDAIGFFQAHPPEGMTSEAGVGGSRNADGSWSTELTFQRPATATLMPAWLLVSVTDAGGRVAVRADTFIPWRPTRPADSYAVDVQSVTVERLGLLPRGRERYEVTDSALQAQLIGTYNALLGTPPEEHSCPARAFVPPFRRITFHLSNGNLVVEEPDYPSCTSGMTVSLDGKRLEPTLEESDAFRGLLDDIVTQGSAE